MADTKSIKVMLPVQTIEELISVSHVSAIVARSGFAPNAIANDYGIDLEVRTIAIYGSKRIDLGSFLALQLKASVNWTLEEGHVVYDIDVDAYNRLIFQQKSSSTPVALVVCCLPKDEAAWLNVCEDELTLKKCCYYYFVNGPESKNVKSTRLRIPRSQLLTPESLRKLKDELYMGQVT